MKFSVIVPVYNSETFIEKCLYSVLNQLGEHGELILVNDGSTDNSLSICESFSKRYANIKVFSGKNRGVSVARNIGIENALGDWLIFLDSDDQLNEGVVVEILKFIDDDKSDFIITRAFLYNDDKLVEERYPFTSDFIGRCFDGKDLVLRYNYKHGSAYACLFNRNFLLKYNIRFPENIKNGEDSIFTTIAHIRAKNVKFLDIDFYRVIERSGSASRSWSLERVLHMTNNLNYLYKYLREYVDFTREEKVIINYNIFGVVTKMLIGIFPNLSFRNYIDVRNAIIKNVEHAIEIDSEKRYRKKILLFNISIDLYAALLYSNAILKRLGR